MDVKPPTNIQPRVIIHGGAGNITRHNLSRESWESHRNTLIDTLRSTSSLLKRPDTSALDAACHAVQLLEEDPKFNAGKGAVFDRSGRIELEASVMVSRGHIKRGVGVSLLRHVRNPINLAKEMLIRGDRDNGGGGQRHVQLSGQEAENLAKEWGLEIVDEQWFWTKKRWEDHKRGLSNHQGAQPATASEFIWTDDDLVQSANEYLPQGTVGCVVLDRFGTLCVATSTGGRTNKLPGRLGDTPTLGAGFWAEEWQEPAASTPSLGSSQGSNSPGALRIIFDWFSSLLHGIANTSSQDDTQTSQTRNRAVAMSGTGDGDSFLRLGACLATSCLARFHKPPHTSLAQAVHWMAGSNGELQNSAGQRWGTTGEGEGGIIGIELAEGRGSIVADFNCGGMYRAWIDDDGKERCMVFKNEF